MKDNNGNQQESSAYKDPEKLRRLYYDKELSTVDIAELAGVSTSTISNWMEKFGINRRDRIEAVKNKRSKRPATRGMTGEGYMQWVSQYDCERDSVRACRLLAVSEYGFEAVKDRHVHHKNGIRWLDYPDNIELLEPKEHLRKHSAGSDNPQSKLKDEEVEKIKALAEDGNITQSEIAERFGISQPHVSDIKNGKKR